MEAHVRVARFGLFPAKSPEGYEVGFNIRMMNKRSFYVDTVVSLEDAEGKDDDEVVQLAWQQAEHDILRKAKDVGEKPELLGKTWVPEGYTIEDASNATVRLDVHEEEEDGEGEEM